MDRVGFYFYLRKLKRTQKKLGRVGFFGSLPTLFLVTSVFLISAVSVVALAYRNGVVSQFEPYLSDPPKMSVYKSDTLTFLDRGGMVIYRTSGRYIEKITPLAETSPYMIKATIASEDKDFYKHSGLDWQAAARAIYNDIKKGDLYDQGGSTISQQLARSIFLSNEKSIARKFKELILAFEIERRYSKEKVLELYLNSVYYGAGAYGVEQAAFTYFGKSPKNLNLAESSLLAGLTPAPSRLSPTNGGRQISLGRQKYVLSQMVKAGFIGNLEAEKAQATKLKFVSKRLLPTQAPHFILYLKERLKEQFPNIELDTSGFIVHTTLDLDKQKLAEKLLEEKVKALKYRNVNNAAFLSTNPKTGEILAMVGSVNFNQREWGAVNVLTRPRSPGSAIKPIIYAAGFETGRITPTTILRDVPVTYNNGWETYSPHNSDGKFRGPMLPRRALSNSLNVPTVEVAARSGIPTIVSTAEKLGITTLEDPSYYWLSIALGGLEVKGIDLATAYGTLANYGEMTRPWGITKIEDKFGKTMYEAKPVKKLVIDERVAFLITHILSDNYTRRELFGWLNPLEIGRPAAVKTGTSQDFKNAWAVGYTPSLLALVWFGNNDESPMHSIWGLESAASVWNSFMRYALAGKPVEAFAFPKGVVVASVCAIDGSKAVAGQPTIKDVLIGDKLSQNYGACYYLAKRGREKVKITSAKQPKKENSLPKEPIVVGVPIESPKEGREGPNRKDGET